ncbi:hypothetical protein ACFYYR_23210 [Streptomyces sp. NPDC001922]|uniref:hypothetical protein n=1 Tax=Streptomyces sp. NPDC001922 TaxID=3364624 RepID=UPI0036C3F44C
MTFTSGWRGGFDDVAVNALHAECFNRPALDVDWLIRRRPESPRSEGVRVGDRPFD